MTTVSQASEEKGLSINIEKTKVMVMSKTEQVPRCIVNVNNKVIKQVGKFCYLGSDLTEDGRCNVEIKRKIFEAKNSFQRMSNIMKNTHLSIKTRSRAVKTYVWSVLLYGCETWTISRQMEQRLEALEMWCWRRLLKITWAQMISNEEVLRRMGLGRELLMHVRGRQMRFLGHVMRSEELENLSLTGRVPGRRASGRQREKYMDGIKRTIGQNSAQDQRQKSVAFHGRQRLQGHGTSVSKV